MFSKLVDPLSAFPLDIPNRTISLRTSHEEIHQHPPKIPAKWRCGMQHVHVHDTATRVPGWASAGRR
jgi:hypothetical protein